MNLIGLWCLVVVKIFIKDVVGLLFAANTEIKCNVGFDKVLVNNWDHPTFENMTVRSAKNRWCFIRNIIEEGVITNLSGLLHLGRASCVN